MSIKILHIITCFSKGGAERVAIELANEAACDGNEVLIIAGWKQDPVHLQNQVNENVQINFISDTNRFAYVKLIFWILQNRKLICNFDILHCHLTFGAFAGTIVNIFLKKLFRYKKPLLVETNHAVGMTVPKHRRWLHALMLRGRDGIVFMANDAYWSAFRRKHTEIKFATILNGISFPAKRSAPSESGKKNVAFTPHKPLVVGSVGVLRPDRMPWLYVSICKQINERFDDQVRFIIAGEGSERKNIEKLLQQSGIEQKVHMAGLVSNPIEVMQQMDVYVSLGVRGIAGISMIEAAMCGVPVVGIQVDQTYTTKETDWFWSHTDIEKVGEKIIDLLDDPIIRNQIASKQYEYVHSNFTAGAMYRKYKKFYLELLNKL